MCDTEQMTSFEKIIAEIENERAYQDGKWGSEFDDKNTLDSWITFIAVYCGRAWPQGHWTRHSLMQVAALAVAACEAYDRNSGFPPSSLEEIFTEIKTTSSGRWQRWDDKNTLDNWIAFIISYCGNARRVGCAQLARNNLLQVAVLAVAACEAYDRNGGFPPSHYNGE